MKIFLINRKRGSNHDETKRFLRKRYKLSLHMGSWTSWENLNNIQKDRKEKIVFMEVIEERGDGSRYAWFRDDEQSTNYLVKLQKERNAEG